MYFNISRDRTLALALTGMFLAGLWLGGSHTYLKRNPVQVRMLPLEDDFIPAPTSTPSGLPAAPMQRRTVTLERSGGVQHNEQVSRRPHLLRSRLQLTADVEVDRSFSTPVSQPERLRMRSSHRLTLNAAAAEDGSLDHNSSDLPEAHATVVSKRRAHRQAVATLQRQPQATQPVAIDELTRWMHLSPAELPPGIKRHVEYQPENLTAAAELKHGGEIWEVYLLVRVPLRELHIVLVRGNDTWYLIDRSFERQGRSFRTGYARREGGVIVGVVSQERPAASEEAAEFYSIFLTWWDQERLKLP